MEKFNVLVSGWPGAGATALTIILAQKLNFKLLRGTETFRFLWKNLSLSKVGVDNIVAERLIQPYFGKIYDEYIDYKLIHDSGFVIDSDIGGFRLGKRKEYFSIFLMPNEETRMKRLSADGRAEDIDFLKTREKELQTQYEKLHKIDWFSVEEIHQKYDYPFDNSHVEIAGELIEVYKKMLEMELIEEEDFIKFADQAEKDEKYFWENGKEKILEEIRESGLLYDEAHVLEDVNKIFPEEIAKFPKELKEIILKHKK